MGQEPHLATPEDNGSAQETSGIRAAFSLDTFFWPRKRKYHAFGCGNPIRKKRRLRHKNFLNQNCLTSVNKSALSTFNSTGALSE